MDLDLRGSSVGCGGTEDWASQVSTAGRDKGLSSRFTSSFSDESGEEEIMMTSGGMVLVGSGLLWMSGLRHVPLWLGVDVEGEVVKSTGAWVCTGWGLGMREGLEGEGT